MSNKRPAPVATGIKPEKPVFAARHRPTLADAGLPAPQPSGLVKGWVNFWFTPTNPVGLHWIRVAAGLLFLTWLLPFAGQLDAFFGMYGWFDWQAYIETTSMAAGPQIPLGWSLLYVFWGSLEMLQVFYWTSLAILVLFTLGVAPRLTAVATWVIVVSFLANPIVRYDADYLLGILAFYLMIGYVFLGQFNRDLSPAARILGTRESFLFDQWLPGYQAEKDEGPRASYAVGFALRLLQVHFALVVLVSGLHKLQFGPWWGGWALFYPLNPPFAATKDALEQLKPMAESYLFTLSLGGYLVLAWQIGFPFLAWRQGWLWRTILLGGAVVGWIGSFFVYELPLFGPVYVIACLSYLTAAEWQAVGRLREQLGLGAAAESPGRVTVGSGV